MPVYVVKPSEEDLMHHGSKGQKWGRRRYQNPDGSLTPLGRQHYGVGGERKSISGPTVALLTGPTASSSKSRKSSRSKKDDYVDAEEGKDWRMADDNGSSSSGSSSRRQKTKKSRTRTEKGDDVMDGIWEKVEETAKNKATKNKKSDTDDNSDEPKKDYKNVSSALSSVSNVSKSLASVQQRKLQSDKAKVMKAMDLSSFSDEDLRKAISRMSSEDTYRKMVADRVDYGRQKTIKRLQAIGEVTAVASSAVGLYSAIRKMKD